MIISCPNCNKQFKIDNSLIPDEGRDLQCGSCNHIWLYKIEEENSKILKLKEEIDSNDIETKVDVNNEEIIENKNPLAKIKTDINNKKKEINLEKQKVTNLSKKTEKIDKIKQTQKKIKTEINNEQKIKISEKQKNSATYKNAENKGSKFFSYLIVFIISFVALIILLDTLKTPLINVFPELEIILFNLFETLQI